MIRHVVFFKFKAGLSAEDKQGFFRSLQELPERVPGIMALEVGEDFMRSPRSYDVALIETFADRAALDHYSSHLSHLPVIARAREICESIVAVDFEA